MISDIGIVVKRFAVVLLLCGVVWGDVEVRCKVREREALLSFKNGLIDELGILSSWRGKECCNWYGVVCSNTTGNVIGLQLHSAYYRGLEGKITPSLVDLHHLTYLDLSNNYFGGVPIPEFIGSMKQLQYLYLRDSGFSGTVPPHLGNLTNLRKLDLSYNLLTFKNSNWLSSFSLLSYLDLSDSFYETSLSNRTSCLKQILNLPSLKELILASCYINDDNLSAGLSANSSSTSLSVLDLSGNYLTPSAFSWLANVSSSLVKIRLSRNGFIGPIPDAFERYIHLEFLDVSYNMFEGKIPKSLGNLTHLRVLVLYDNKLSGKFCEIFENISPTGILASLEILELSHNKLNGAVPDLTPFSALTEVYLGSNEITGTLPLSVGHLANLRILEVSYNKLEGSVIESHFIKLHNLKTLDLSNSSLKLNISPDWIPPFQLENMVLVGCNVGPSFPKWIQTQTNLSFLDLSSASIVDEVPMWLWSFSPSLQGLFLSHNQISGTIPDLSSIPLQDIDVSDNKFSGLIPLFHPITDSLQLSRNMFSGNISSICRTHHDRLLILGLSSNQLSGELPSCWEKMPNLVSLELANNIFSNKIPHSLGSLGSLLSLQLHENSLSGELPSTLRFCRLLRFIDVRGNELTGEIPTWIGEMNDLILLNLGNNRLHGSIPPSICNLHLLRILDIHMNNFSGGIPDCFESSTLNGWDLMSSVHFREDSYLFYYNPQLPNSFVRFHGEYTSIGFKGRDSVFKNSLFILGLFDFSSNRLTGNIPHSFSNLGGLLSLNLSRNILTGNIISDIGQMEILEALDLSNNQLSGEIPASMAQLPFLSFLNLSNNNLSGKIPLATQLQSFDASSYAGNDGLCGQPLTLCPQDTVARGEKGDVYWRLSFMQECGISMGFGFIFGFWGLIGSFILKKSWRYAFFNMMDGAGEWLCLRYEMNMKQRSVVLAACRIVYEAVRQQQVG